MEFFLDKNAELMGARSTLGGWGTAKGSSWIVCGLVDSDDNSSSLAREKGRVSTLTSCVLTMEPRPRLSSDLATVDKEVSEHFVSKCCLT